MRIDIKTDGIEVTQQMRERLDWICSKLEKMADAKDPDMLHCDFVVSKIEGKEGENEFRAEVTFFDGSGQAHRAIAIAESPLVALDTAHDKIEREFFQEQRIHRDKQKIKDFTVRRAELIKKRKADLMKKYKEEPPRAHRGDSKDDD
ncbi:hypothetical protein A2851_00580 [Candidatus Kaiserbacteria bacterium RIFCSPHIGHO2_01_FULL_53_29]|uniref:Ribosomal subunit interface protein n=1 Tax=Candidatus Kaiserbacteria bacterium RIFCSPHIGHO2_01_FULL_53_29 TaxID=1798480 RepID=A0A1F6CU31_9BACT|nr:MAG: hypothetical protein A2851_00580 [Candidatus Kaiserbacteria bacterium RIFCSPHIGHO2_01_FULL_53_29]